MIGIFRQKFSNSAIAKNIFLLSVGTIIAQAIPILLQPILKRIFSPEDFGIFEIYLKVLGFLVVIYSMKYEIGIVLPKNKAKAVVLLNLAVTSAIFFTVFFEIIIFLFQNQILQILKLNENFSFVLYILPISTLFYSLFNTFNYFLIREKKFKQSSYNKITRRASEGITQILFVCFKNNKSFGLIIGDFIGNIVYFVSAYYQSFKFIPINKKLLKPKLIFKVAKEFIELPKYNIFPELLNSLFGATLSFLILAKFSIEEVGFMELTQRILIIPSAFISISIGQVLLQRISELISEKKSIKKEIFNVFKYLALSGIPFIIVIVLFSNNLFSFVFGKEWFISGVYSKYLVIFFTFSFVFSPLGQVLIALKKFKINALWQIGKLLIIASLFLINFSKIEDYLLIYNILGSLVYLIYGIIVFISIKKYESKIIEN